MAANRLASANQHHGPLPSNIDFSHSNFFVHFVYIPTWSCKSFFVDGLSPYFAVCVCMLRFWAPREVRNQDFLYIFVMGTQRCQFDASPSTMTPIHNHCVFSNNHRIAKNNNKVTGKLFSTTLSLRIRWIAIK
jgi:hypothetical protein